jgi:hypothetical protein
MADKGTQTSLRLPSDLYDKLTKAAGDTGIGEEIRQRLEVSFAGQPPAVADEPTRELLGAISFAAQQCQAMLDKPWHAHPDVFHAFKEAVAFLLRAFEPPGETKLSEKEREFTAAMLTGLGASRLADDRARRLMAMARKEDAEQARREEGYVPPSAGDAVQHISTEGYVPSSAGDEQPSAWRKALPAAVQVITTERESAIRERNRKEIDAALGRAQLTARTERRKKEEENKT